MLTIQEILKASKGKLLKGKSAIKVKGISIDSRTFKAGDLFIAIKGNNFDGHDFINVAIEKRASSVMIAKGNVVINKDIPVILVKDTIVALGHLARFVRTRAKIPVIAITGSTGKTTTKELVACVLETRYKVLKNVGTQNNHIGVPMTLLKLNKDHEAVILECGTNRFGDIPWLADVARPNVVIFTNIGESHLEGLKTLEGVFHEKYGLTKYMTSDDTIILNNDDRCLKKIPDLNKKQKLISFGYEDKTDYHASQIQLVNNQKISFSVNQQKNWILRTPSAHNVYNALVAISCGRLFHIPYNEIKKALRRFEFPCGRQTIQKKGPYWIIDDTYNANPISLRSALRTLADLKVKGRRILVCADMLELGSQARVLHRSVGKEVAELNFDLLLTFGEYAKLIAQTAQDKDPRLVAYHCRSINQVHHRLKNFCRPGDAILVKGSRGMHMERTVDFLNKNFISNSSNHS